MTSSNQTNNNQNNGGWDSQQARRSSCGALIQENMDRNYQDPNLSVTPQDVTAIESTYKGHKTKVFVCQSLANLYTCPKISTMSNSVSNWVLTFTGVPVLLLDLGTTRSRTKRQIQLLLVEKGTCFTLWQDVVDNLTRYSSTNDGLFHTLHLSTDHSVRVGLSFDSKPAAQSFHDKVLQLTNDPENVALKGPRRNLGATKSHYYLDNLPNKMDISQPCGFQHVVSVSQNDFKKYFSLQTFVSSNSPDNVNPKCVQNNMKNTQQNRVLSAKTKYSTPTPIQQMPLQPDQQTLPLPLLPSDSSNSPMSTSSSNSSTTSSTSGDYMQRRKKSPAPPPPVNFTNMRISTINTKYQQSHKPICNMLTTQSRSCHDIYQL